MRLISFDGSVDVPYESVRLEWNHSIQKVYAIPMYYREKQSNDYFILGKYNSKEKLNKVKRMFYDNIFRSDSDENPAFQFPSND